MDAKDKQKIYDAMLIRAWRKDAFVNDLRYWLKPYDIDILDPELKRTTKYMQQYVRRFVGTFLKPLSDRLFDTDPSQDIKTLAWLGASGLNSQNTDKALTNLMATSNRTERRQRLLGNLIRKDVLMDHAPNQGNIVKGRIKVKSIKSRHK